MFRLQIDPAEVANKFGFKCTESTVLEKYTKPPEYEIKPGYKIIHSLLHEGNEPFYLCMWCARSTTHPIGLPVSYVDTKIRVNQISLNTGEEYSFNQSNTFIPKFLCTGIFCTINCAKAYWEYNKYRIELRYSGLYLQQIWDIEYGKNTKFIAAPPRETLKIFGGTLDYDEFHKHHETKKWSIVCAYNTNHVIQSAQV